MTDNNFIFNDNIDSCIASKGVHYDVAKVIYELIKNKYIYNPDKNIWYYYNDNILLIDNKQEKLKQEIKSNVINAFILRGTYWDDTANKEQDINIKLHNQLNSFTLFQIANKLKDNKYLNNIIKELRQFFNSDNIDVNK